MNVKHLIIFILLFSQQIHTKNLCLLEITGWAFFSVGICQVITGLALIKYKPNALNHNADGQEKGIATPPATVPAIPRWKNFIRSPILWILSGMICAAAGTCELLSTERNCD